MSLTTWNRLQPNNQVGNVAAGLQAPLADPLWLLGRQWQIGELTAEDAGTPVAATIDSTSYPLDRLVAGGTTRMLDSNVTIEALVEPEPAVAPDVRARLAGGRDLVAALRGGGFTSAAATAANLYVMQPPAERAALALVRALGVRAIDGERALSSVETNPDITAQQLDAGADPVALLVVLRAWAAAYRERTGRAAPSAWDAASGRYQFSVVATVGDNDVWLDANEYRGGRLDWIDLRGRVEPRAAESQSQPQPRTQVLLPTPLSFAGGPARRFFELEHSAVSFGAIAGAPPDVGTSLLVETALLYGGDWFVAPVEVPTCALTRIDRIAVTDTFGKVTTLRHRIRSPGWRMFEVGGDTLADFLIVLPTLNTSLDGPPIEEVLLGIDEAANVVWAIENTVSDSLGLRVERQSTPVSLRGAAGAWTYVPLVPPPMNWFPLVRDGDQLVGAALVPQVLRAAPFGVLLSNWPEIRFAVRDVPGEGLRLNRRYQLATTRSGERRLWISHEYHHGLGGLGSGVAADRLFMPRDVR